MSKTTKNSDDESRDGTFVTGTDSAALRAPRIPRTPLAMIGVGESGNSSIDTAGTGANETQNGTPDPASITRPPSPQNRNPPHQLVPFLGPQTKFSPPTRSPTTCQ